MSKMYIDSKHQWSIWICARFLLYIFSNIGFTTIEVRNTLNLPSLADPRFSYIIGPSVEVSESTQRAAVLVLAVAVLLKYWPRLHTLITNNPVVSSAEVSVLWTKSMRCLN